MLFNLILIGNLLVIVIGSLAISRAATRQPPKRPARKKYIKGGS